MGFDNECILNIETLAGEYFCPVCRTLVYPHEAIQTQCTHLYCKPCLTYVVGSTQACPYEGYLVTKAASKPLMESNKALADAIGKTSVHCLYHRSGCVWQGPLSECTAHCAGCGFGNSPVVCNQCGVQIVHRQVQEHCNNVNVIIKQQQQYYQRYPPYQQQQQPYQQYYPPYQQQPQAVQSQPQMQQQIQAPIQPLPQPPQFQMQSQGQAIVPGPAPPSYPPQQAYSQPQVQHDPPQSMMQQYSQPQPHYPPPLRYSNPPVPPQPHMRPPPHMLPPQPQPPMHQQRPFIQQPMPPQQPPAFPSFAPPPPQPMQPPPPPPLAFVQPQSYMGRPPPMSQQFPTAIPPPHTGPPQFQQPPSVTLPPPPHVVYQRQQNRLRIKSKSMEDEDQLLPFPLQKEIIEKFPVRSLLRFRLVCKAWKDFIDSSEFVVAQSRHSKSAPKHVFIANKLSCDDIRVFSGIDDREFPQNISIATVPSYICKLVMVDVVGSSKGLICIQGYDRTLKKHAAVLWNPTIRKSVTIPLCEPASPCVGFGVSPTNGDPKLFSLGCLSDLCAAEHYRLQIYTMSSGEWKPVCLAYGIPLHCNIVCFLIHSFVFKIFDRERATDQNGFVGLDESCYKIAFKCWLNILC